MSFFRACRVETSGSLNGLLIRPTAIAAAIVLLTANWGIAQVEYSSADEAFLAGAKLLRERKIAESRQPLEAALKLAPDEAFRFKVYRALLASYRMLDEIDKMVEASEFVINHADLPAERSNVTTGLASFLYQRGKIDFAVDRYEKLLQKEPENFAAIGTLVRIYTRIERDADRAKVLQARLAEVEKQASGKRAEQLEKDAAFAPQTAAWHWKDAAVAWLAAGENQRAVAAAKKAVEAGPETRTEQLAHFWHKALGDVFLQTGEAKLAVEHFEKAIELTKIEGYLKDCRTKLAEAQSQLKNEE